MDVHAWNPHLTKERAAAAAVTRAASPNGSMAGSDWVSIHLVLSDSTQGLIGRSELRAMRRGARLVNTSRAVSSTPTRS